MCDASQTPPMHISQNTLLISISCFLLLACATEKYEAKPFNLEKSTVKILAKDPLDANFQAYLSKQGYASANLTWGLDELTLCALYFNPKLDVAKAQFALASAQVDSAGQQQNPTLNGNIAHSNLSNGDKRPWADGLNVEIPIETANKRAIRVEEALDLATASRMDVADTAWQLRNQIANDLTEYHQNIATAKLIQNELDIQSEVVNMLKKRMDNGLVSKTDLSLAQFAQLKTQASLNNAQAKSVEIQARLANDVGLTLEMFRPVNIKALDMDATLARQANALDEGFVNKALQADTLLNRIDIRRSLAKYEAAEAKIKLEIARQMPDISLTPGIAFEFGDSIWSLGFSSLLNLVNKNAKLINEAKQLREVEGAQFEALQAQIIGDLNQQYANYQAARQVLAQAQSQYTSQLQHMQKLQKQFDSGLIDRLELKQNSLTNIIALQQVVAAQFETLKAANQLENIMQKPLYTDFVMPSLQVMP